MNKIILLGESQGCKEVIPMFKEGDKWRKEEGDTVIRYFDSRLARLLSTNHISITDLAKLLGKSHTNVSRWVHGRAMPPSDIQEQIAGILGCTSRAEIWIFKGNGDLHAIVLKLNQLNKKKMELEKEVEKIISKGDI